MNYNNYSVDIRGFILFLLITFLIIIPFFFVDKTFINGIILIILLSLFFAIYNKRK